MKMTGVLPILWVLLVVGSDSAFIDATIYDSEQACNEIKSRVGPRPGYTIECVKYEPSSK